MKLSRFLTLIIALIVIFGLIYWLEAKKAPRVAAKEVPAPKFTAPRGPSGYPRAKEIANPSGFVNAGPITISQFIGQKVILVDFMAYSCINCQRTYPYLNAWWNKYKDLSLIHI